MLFRSSASRELATYLNPDATVVSLQNGVDNVKQIREASGIEALAGLVYVAVAADTPGRVKDAGRGGWDLVIGPKCGRARGVAEMFARAGVPCRVSRNMQSELWTKLIWNCALNAISGLGKAKYGEIAGSREAREMVRAVVSEVLEVARAARIVLPGFENTHPAMEGAMKIAAQMAEARSSTARDLERGKRTEIDSLNGYIARCGERLGIATPVNQALTALVKLREVRPSAPAG